MGEGEGGEKGGAAHRKGRGTPATQTRTSGGERGAAPRLVNIRARIGGGGARPPHARGKGV